MKYLFNIIIIILLAASVFITYDMTQRTFERQREHQALLEGLIKLELEIQFYRLQIEMLENPMSPAELRERHNQLVDQYNYHIRRN